MNFTGKQIQNFRRGCYIVVSLLIFHEFAYFIHFTSYHGHVLFYLYNESESERSFVDGLPPINIPTEIDNSRRISRSSTAEEEVYTTNAMQCVDFLSSFHLLIADLSVLSKSFPKLHYSYYSILERNV